MPSLVPGQCPSTLPGLSTLLLTRPLLRVSCVHAACSAGIPGDIVLAGWSSTLLGEPCRARGVWG